MLMETYTVSFGLLPCHLIASAGAWLRLSSLTWPIEEVSLASPPLTLAPHKIKSSSLSHCSYLLQKICIAQLDPSSP